MELNELNFKGWMWNSDNENNQDIDSTENMGNSEDGGKE